MSKDNTLTWVVVGVAAVGVVYFLRSQVPPATPLSIYPSLAWTAITSMAATPAQKASTAVIPPTPQFASVQEAEQSAVLGQCMGSPVCSPLAGDTQLGV
jgi:hypothetical protein